MTGSQSMRALVTRIVGLERRIDALSRSNRLEHASIHNGGISFYDSEGSLAARLGLQEDGAWLMRAHKGPEPGMPTAPTVTAGVGAISVAWEGLMLDGGAPTTDMTGVDVLVTRNGGQLGEFSVKGHIPGTTGGETVVVAEAGVWDVCLASRSSAGRSSGYSPVATVEVTVGDSAQGLVEARAELEEAQARLATLEANLAALESAMEAGDQGTLEAALAALVPLDKLTSGTGVGASVASSLWQDVVVSKFLISTQKIITNNVIANRTITGSLLADGAVTARTLNVTAGGSASSLSIKPDGIRMYGAGDRDEYGAEVGVPSISLTTGEDQSFSLFNEADQRVVALDSSGLVYGRQGAFSHSLLYRGAELGSLLSQAGHGVVAVGATAPQAVSLPSNTNSPAMRLRWEVPSWYSADRHRLMRVSGCLTFVGTSDAHSVRVRLHKSATAEAAVHNTAMRGAIYDFKPQGAGSWRMEFSKTFDTGEEFGAGLHAGDTLSILVAVEVRGVSQLLGSEQRTNMCFLEDLGPSLPMTVTAPPSGGTAPVPPQIIEHSYETTGFMVFKNDGADQTSYRPHAYQGYYSGAHSMGVKVSHFYFDAAKMQADLAGATVLSASVYLQNNSWYGQSGRVGLWTHPYGSVRSSMGNMAWVGDAGMVRGEGRTLGLPTDGWGSSRLGVGLRPPGGSTSSTYYGTFVQSAPVLKLVVRK